MGRQWDDLTEKEKQRMSDIWKRGREIDKMLKEIDTELEELRDEKLRIRKGDKKNGKIKVLSKRT